ncbi:MAG: hypothetical protein WBY12_02225, partial [Hyphomicrobium sp.]
ALRGAVAVVEGGALAVVTAVASACGVDGVWARAGPIPMAMEIVTRVPTMKVHRVEAGLTFPSRMPHLP